MTQIRPAGRQWKDAGACLCGGREYEIARGPFTAQDLPAFEVIACRACGLARTYPSPFADDRTAAVHQELSYHDVIARESLWRSFSAPIIAAARSSHSAGKFLDVGCGVGLCVQMAQEAGFDAWGVEINVRSATFARETLGRRVLNTDLVDACFSKDSFSVVLLSNVLEHLANPHAVTDEILRVLAPDGVLIVEVPNMGGLQPTLLGARWTGWAPDMHMWQFTPETLRRSLERLGFCVQSMTARRSMHMGRPRGIVKRLIRYTLWHPLEILAFATNRGDKILCLARKARELGPARRC